MKENKRMKKIITIFAVLFISFSCSSIFDEVYAENNIDSSTEEILKNQSDSIGISSFIEAAKKYKNDDLDIDVEEIISSAIKGNIDNKTLGKKILSILGVQLEETIATIRKHNDYNYNIKCFKEYK